MQRNVLYYEKTKERPFFMEHLCDLHTHTWYSADARCSVDELCAAAVRRGLFAVGMTEHYDYDPWNGTAYYELRHERRMAEVARAKAAWAGQVELLCGIELGQPHLCPEKAAAFVKDGGFDLVIGSLHDLRPGKSIYHDLPVDTPEGCDALYEAFFREARELVRVCDVDIFGHYDYPLRVMGKAGIPPNMERWRTHMTPFLRDLAESGIALELNTCGLRRWMGRTAGESWILETFRSFGGSRITIGSDAHFTRDVGAGVKETCALLRENGFDKVTIFRQRKPESVSI